MQCNRCRSDPVIFQPYSGRNLCRDHFIADFEARAKRAIRKHQWMRPGDHIGIPLSGDPAGNALLFFLRDLAGRRRDIQISILSQSLDLPGEPGNSGRDGVMERSGLTQRAVPTSLDEVAISVLSGLLRGSPCPGLNTRTQYRDTGEMLACAYPFAGIPEAEIELYARLQGVGGDRAPDEHPRTAFDTTVKTLLDEYSSRHPATKYAIAHLGSRLAGCDPAMDRDAS